MTRLLSLALVMAASCAAPRVAQEAPLPPAPTLRAAFERMPSPAKARVLLLPDNVDAWVERWRVLSAAKHSLDVQYFIISSDAFGLAFLGLLHEKREQGLDVRVMVDSRGTPGLTRAFLGTHILDELAGVGAEVRVYNTLESELSHGDLRKIIASNHDKLIIADGETTILGGRNISAEYLSDPRDLAKAFNDMDIVVEGGDAARALTKAFTSELTTNNANEVHAHQNDDERDILALAVAAMRVWLGGDSFDDGEIGKLNNPDAQAATAEEVSKAAVAQLDHPPTDKARAELKKIAKELVTLPRLRGALTHRVLDERAVADDVRVLDTHSAAAPAMRDRVTENLLVAVGAAKHEVVLESPYLVLSERGIATLEKAAQRGVRVTFFTNSPVSSDNPATQAAFIQQWPHILARVPTARLFVMGVPQLMHAKVAIIDEQLAFVGSYNLDPISAHVNGEVVTAIWSPAVAHELHALVDEKIGAGEPVVYEYRLAHDAKGAVAFDVGGKPIIGFGPDDHVDPGTMTKVRAQEPVVALLSPLF